MSTHIPSSPLSLSSFSLHNGANCRTFKADKGRALPYKRVGIPHERLRILRNMITLEFIMDTLHIHGFLDAPPSLERRENATMWRKELIKSIAKVIGPKAELPKGFGDDWLHPRIRKQSLLVEPVQDMVARLEAKKKIVTTTSVTVSGCHD